MDTLRRLTDIAMELVRDVSSRALDPNASNEAVCELSLSFNRLDLGQS